MAGAQTSTISQADADSKGLSLFNTNGQANANTNGICTFSSIAKSGSFTKNDCAVGGVGSSVAFSQLAGAQTSTVSQADADSKGFSLFNTNGQANANANGNCTFSSIAKSGSFTKNNCDTGGVGSAVAYTVPAGRYTSTTSQAIADELAQTDVNNNGQANANTTGTCTLPEVEFLYEYFFNTSTKQFTIDAWATGTNHNGATLNFTVNFTRTSGTGATQVIPVVFTAGQGDKITTITLNAKAILSVSLQVIKK